MWTRAELKDNAKKFFKFNYWKMVLVALVLTMVSGGGSSAGSRSARSAVNESSYGGYMSPAEAAGFMVGFLTIMLVVMVVGIAVSFFLLNPLVVGAQRFYVVSHYQKA